MIKQAIRRELPSAYHVEYNMGLAITFWVHARPVGFSTPLRSGGRRVGRITSVPTFVRLRNVTDTIEKTH